MKKWISIVLLTMILLCITGCSEEKRQAGIWKVGEKTFYTIAMNKTERMEYFTLTGAGGQIAVADTRNPGQIYVVSWSAVEGGGWISWKGDRVVYVPEGFSEQERTTACAGVRDDSSAMTIEEAKAYVPQLADKEE